MTPEELDKQVQYVQEHLRSLCERVGTPHEHELMQSALEQLSIATHELQVTAEELSERADELSVSQEALDFERRRYLELFDFAPDGYLVTSPDMLIEEANLAAARLLGVRREFLINKPLIVFFPIDQRHAVRTLVDRLRMGSDTVSLELRLEPRDRPVFFAAVLVAPIVAELNRVKGLRWSFRDVTRIKEAEVRALQSERLAAIGQMVAGLAHESRNALQRSKACLDMLNLEVKNQPAAIDLVERLKKAQHDLHELHEQVRQYAAPVVLRRQVCQVDQIIQDVWQELDCVWRDRKVTLRIDRDRVNATCEVDPFRLQQVFRNLLENSLTACSDPVAIEAECRDDELDGVAALRIAIRDNGPGLTNEQRSHLFHPFYTTKTRGTGLGMAIAHRVIEAHGGRIQAGIPVGQGTEIVILLPRHATASQPEGEQQTADQLCDEQARAKWQALEKSNELI